MVYIFIGVSQIVSGWCGHQTGRAAVVGVLTDHNNQTAATIYDAPIFIGKEKVLFFSILLFISCNFLYAQNNDSNQYKFSAAIYNNIKKDSGYWLSDRASFDFSLIGFYKEAITEWDKIRPSKTTIPIAQKQYFLKNFKPVDAKSFILQKAKQNQVIIFNEAHHNPRNRVFVASLLKDLKAIGYKYFAAEAFNTDSIFKQTIHPSFATGIYTMEPQFGNLVREAVRLNFVLYPYEDNTGADNKFREINEARNIKSLLKLDPDGKIIIYCGFSHIYEDSVFGWEKAMAGGLKEFTKIDPYTIDQIDLVERSNKNIENPYYKLIKEKKYSIFIDKNNIAFNKKLNKQSVDALLYYPPTKYIYNRPDWIFENNKIPYFVQPISITVSYPLRLKVYKETDNLETAIPIDIIEIKSVEELKKSAVAVTPNESFILKLSDKKGKVQIIKVSKKL